MQKFGFILIAHIAAHIKIFGYVKMFSRQNKGFSDQSVIGNWKGMKIRKCLARMHQMIVG